MKKVLVLGGTGAMGQYLVPELLSMGYLVDSVALDKAESFHPNLRCIQGNVKENGLLDTLLADEYDGIVDFMTYHTEEFRETYRKLLDHTGHYIFLSSCRVFADDPPITERSARLLDESEDKDYLATDDYSLYKAREEDILRNSGYKNWTIVRPATTYSRGRFQLVTLEAGTVIYRMQAGKTIVLPEEAMDCPATLTWGGDVAKMLARLLFNEKAYGDDFNVATAEHNTWREIAAIYNELVPLNYITVDKETYIDIIANGSIFSMYQLKYARMFRRITDNSKVLAATGLKQADFKTLRQGLAFEYERSKGFEWAKCASSVQNLRMDEYLNKKNSAKL